jgi:hypothetical protein
VQIRILTSGVEPSDVKARVGARGRLASPYAHPHEDGTDVMETVFRHRRPVATSLPPDKRGLAVGILENLIGARIFLGDTARARRAAERDQ